MNSTYLITRPEHDDTTHYLSNWCRETIKFAETRGIKVLDLNREKAIRKEFEGRINSFSPNLIVLNGHGSENSVTGHKNEVIISVNDNENLLKSKIIYAISCKSAKNLGPKSIEAGAINYTGYDDDFIFIYEPTSFSRPLDDKTASLFLEPSTLFINSLIKGNAIKEALKKSKEMIKENMLKSISNNDINSAKYLWWNLMHFISHGNIDATIY